jgi:rubrerythrin
MKEKIDALKVALNNELNEHKFYLKHAERTTNSAGKAMFKQIASEELSHYEALKKISETWSKGGKWPGTVSLKVKGTVVGDVLKGLLKEADRIPRGERNDVEAIREAIEFEAQGCSYYAKLRDDCSDPAEKEFFNLMANIEHEHYVSLKETEELLLDPAQWFRSHERGGLDGA